MRYPFHTLLKLAPHTINPSVRGAMGDKQKVAFSALKRKADGDLDGLKTTTRARISIRMKYANGAIRITRTPGRKHAKNCIILQDIIHKDYLESACIYSFFIAEDEIYEYLPFSHSAGGIPIYIGRDPNLDVPTGQEASMLAGVNFQEKVSRKQLDSIRPALQQLHSRRYGQNIHTFYAWGAGSCHSKVLLLVYPTFLRIVITSCNMMTIDTELGDNHWYVHDVPKRHSPSTPTGFEADLLSHMEALGTPEDFLESIRGGYDYSTVKVHLITSAPGTCSGAKAEKHGLLRLRQVIKQLDLKLAEKNREGKLQLEICTASVGNLNARWLNGFYDCALGKDTLQTHDGTSAVPKLKLFYPTFQDVKNADQVAQDAASNIGCHTRPWESVPREVKSIFHHYESKDCGKLFHQKLVIAYNPRDSTQLPYYVYIGSANFSQSAWGALEHDKRGNPLTSDKKLIKLSNFECGVLIPGHLISELLEDGTESWQDGIIPHNQSAATYDLPKDRAWNDYRWTKDYREAE
ncbi:tyrosyl-DNA phosphodiesterase I [Xylaria bambusicola]|uniref:tyrosyl-DNA phosphodiesterase I n=1 Tax=Xylaria bambusicola TaxID=326684 RepID=UPI0020075FFC|nr:tyrosyl-DNA phosphodiesterase I [Xylaria bambusicola]KAI0516949.1 tyrosyl-DNA phosphodiesterase I [Xylaria bambusicola]